MRCPHVLHALFIVAMLIGCGDETTDPPDASDDAAMDATSDTAADTATDTVADAPTDAPVDAVSDTSTDGPMPECGPGDPCGMKMSCCDGRCTSACCAGQVICGFVCCPAESGCDDSLPNSCA